MKHIHSYSSIYNLGHKMIQDLFDGQVEITEKQDGSQISFANLDGELCARSKGKDLIIEAPEKMFNKAIEVIKTLDLRPNWIYRGEFFSKPKHNTLNYSRTPKNNIILFNIEIAPGTFLNHEDMTLEANRLGLEVVPLIYFGPVGSYDIFKSFLEKESILGGVKIEGVVIKNYSKFTSDKKVMMGKYVSEAFKEVHQKEWKVSNPSTRDILGELILKYKTDARYSKSIQHLRDEGKLTDSLKDIGFLIKECQNDIKKEEEENIKQELFDYFWPKIQRSIVSGIPQFYKDYLTKKNFEDAPK